MAHSSSKPASICNKSCRSIFAPMKSSFSCRPPEYLVSSRNRSTSWPLKTDCGTAFQGRTCKVNYPFCPSLHGKKQHKGTCQPKLSARCNSKFRNGYTRRNRCIRFSKMAPQMKPGEAGKPNDERTSKLEWQT